jgi:hypothetical protein
MHALVSNGLFSKINSLARKAPGQFFSDNLYWQTFVNYICNKVCKVKLRKEINEKLFTLRIEPQFILSLSQCLTTRPVIAIALGTLFFHLYLIKERKQNTLCLIFNLHPPGTWDTSNAFKSRLKETKSRDNGTSSSEIDFLDKRLTGGHESWNFILF